MVLFTVFKQFDTRGAAGAGYVGYSDFLEEAVSWVERVSSTFANEPAAFPRQCFSPLSERPNAITDHIHSIFDHQVKGLTIGWDQKID